MTDYEIVIGLETHVQLLTESKIFCGCGTKFGQKPQSATCPVCQGLPGALPVLNEKAFKYAIKTALALGCKIQDVIKFDRKNYYYPDLPKNFQISQYDMPLGYAGFLKIDIDKKEKKIGITRVHLEEDAGKLIHDEKKGECFLDLNRAGMPLLEIVSEPDLRLPEEANIYLQSIRAILRYLEVSDCNMEEGSLRCDANISVRKKGEKELGVKTELKNMNSFKSVRDALGYEADRQLGLVKSGQNILQETRLWDEPKKMTRTMRVKEEAHDYRYFPEPDLIPFVVRKEEIEEISCALPELPRAKNKRFMSKYGLGAYDAGVLTRDAVTSDFFEETVKLVNKPKDVANWILGDVASILNEKKLTVSDTPFKPAALAELISLMESGNITGKVAKAILPDVIISGQAPKELVLKKGLSQIVDTGEITAIVEDVIKDNAKSSEDYRKGKSNALMFLVGQVMKKTRGKANPKIASDLLKKRLNNEL